jgi:hypothetical protein
VLIFRGPIRTLTTIRINTKYKEVMEVKRVYKHPLYKFGRGYDNIALVELERRIAYDYDIFGDSPTCMDLGKFLPPTRIEVGPT